MTATEQGFNAGVEAAKRVYRALKLLRGLVQEGGVPRYTVTPGAALNSIIEEDVDPALLFAARNIATLALPETAPAGDAGWWTDMENAPPVEVGCEREFIVAVYRARFGKAYTFAASYLNAYPLQYQYECPKGDGCDRNGCDDGCPTTGWFEQTGDDDYSSMYNRLELNPGDKLLGYREIPKWNGPLPSVQGGE